MAIVIQEEQGKKGGWFGFGILFTILIIMGIAVYYLFFIQPSLINTTIAPLQLQSLNQMQSLNFDPQSVITHTVINGTNNKQSIPVPNPSTGNSTPFGVL